uniref:FHA domain-containing protein n=1 Tax=Mycobacterium sp. HUMS_1102779 TaxID=3383487 RepID=UPI00389AA49A
MAIDNDSLNGTFVDGRRSTVVEIQDGQRINLGAVNGPILRFEVGRHQGPGAGIIRILTRTWVAGMAAPFRPARAAIRTFRTSRADVERTMARTVSARRHTATRLSA